MFTNRLILETDRLQITPLTHPQLINYLQADGSLEAELGLRSSERPISLELIEAFEKVIVPAVGNPAKNFLFSTLWTVIDKEKKVMVGDLCFKGEVNTEGELIIIFGTYPQYQRQGYMTEAIGAICQWAFEQPHVTSILAETNCNHLASQKILINNGFKTSHEANKTIWWRLQKVELMAVERA